MQICNYKKQTCQDLNFKVIVLLVFAYFSYLSKSVLMIPKTIRIDPVKQTLNPFKPNGISLHYQLDQSISILRVVLWYFFHFYSNFNRTFCKQTVETLIRCHILRHLIWVSTVCQCPSKRTLVSGHYMSPKFLRSVGWQTFFFIKIKKKKL